MNLRLTACDTNPCQPWAFNAELRSQQASTHSLFLYSLRLKKVLTFLKDEVGLRDRNSLAPRDNYFLGHGPFLVGPQNHSSVRNILTTQPLPLTYGHTHWWLTHLGGVVFQQLQLQC